MQQINYNPDRRQYVELFLAGRDLPNVEIFSKSDPQCDIYYTVEGEKEVLLGETEVVYNNLDPNWEKSLTLEYLDDVKQTLRFQIFDFDSKEKKLLLGEFQTTLKEIMGQPKFLAIGLLVAKENPRGKIYIKALPVEESNQFVSWQFVGEKLINTDGLFSLTDPFLKFYNFSEGIWCQVHKTEFIANCLNPMWFEFEISLQRLCNNDETKKFKVECFDWHEKGKANRLIGSFETTIDEIWNKNKTSFNINMPKGGSGGTIRIVQKKRVFRANFNDYINQGTTFNTVIGIDYSIRNGNPRFPDSLHFINEQASNTYSQALQNSLPGVEAYNQSRQMAIYGICAEPHIPAYYQNTMQTLFPLTGDFKQPQVVGTAEAIKLYWSTIPLLQFNGDLALKDFLDYVNQLTTFNQGKLKYTICVIFTCGQLDETEEVKKSLIGITSQPCSLIFVGVDKNNNFKLLKDLLREVAEASPKKRINSVFIDYCKYSSNPALLRRYIRAEIPQQLVSYYNLG